MATDREKIKEKLRPICVERAMTFSVKAQEIEDMAEAMAEKLADEILALLTPKSVAGLEELALTDETLREFADMYWGSKFTQMETNRKIAQAQLAKVSQHFPELVKAWLAEHPKEAAEWGWVKLAKEQGLPENYYKTGGDDLTTYPSTAYKDAQQDMLKTGFRRVEL